MEIDRQALREVIADETRLGFGEEIPEKFLSDAVGRRKEPPGFWPFRRPRKKSAGFCGMPTNAIFRLPLGVQEPIWQALPCPFRAALSWIFPG